MLKLNKSINEICELRKLKKDTIEKHCITLIEDNKLTNLITCGYNSVKFKQISEQIKKLNITDFSDQNIKKIATILKCETFDIKITCSLIKMKAEHFNNIIL